MSYCNIGLRYARYISMYLFPTGYVTCIGMISSSKEGDSRKAESSYLKIGYDWDNTNIYYFLNELSV
jgi:hypothetical protein